MTTIKAFAPNYKNKAYHNTFTFFHLQKTENEQVKLHLQMFHFKTLSFNITTAVKQ